jgi:hypothetical protein
MRQFYPIEAAELGRRLSLLKAAQERELRVTQIALGEIEPVGLKGLAD